LFTVFSTSEIFAQADTTNKLPQKLYSITTNDGGEFQGTIISQDAKEVLINTRDRGQISIPKYQIKEIKEIQKSELSASGEYMPAEVFATRYVITTNGLPIEKRESYILWNLWGPDFEFGVGKNLGVGVMTSWVGVPIIGTIKYSINLAPKFNMALGGLLGTGSWAEPSFGLAVPYVVFTLGDRKSNISFSGGYGAVIYQQESNGRGLLSIAGMTKVGKKISLVFDSFIAPKTGDLQGLSIFIPGIRLQTESNKTFQFGFGAISSEGQTIPIPFVQFFRKL
jgi:sporulation protein YlmC with PRC-barrel domain